MKTFEYHKVAGHLFIDELNDLGRRGWELVTENSKGYLIFKRELPRADVGCDTSVSPR